MINIQLDFTSDTKEKVMAITESLKELGFKCDIYNSGVIFAKCINDDLLALFTRQYFTGKHFLAIFKRGEPEHTLLQISAEHINSIYSL